jgi:hypothetical protein
MNNGRERVLYSLTAQHQTSCISAHNHNGDRSFISRFFNNAVYAPSKTDTNLLLCKLAHIQIKPIVLT